MLRFLDGEDQLLVCTPNSPVFRIGRLPSPWQPPDWSYAKEDGTFGNRFDDPAGRYRVLYVASQRLACFVETLARFRPDIVLFDELADIDGENDPNITTGSGMTPLDDPSLNPFGRAVINSVAQQTRPLQRAGDCVGRGALEFLPNPGSGNPDQSRQLELQTERGSDMAQENMGDVLESASASTASNGARAFFEAGGKALTGAALLYSSYKAYGAMKEGGCFGGH